MENNSINNTIGCRQYDSDFHDFKHVMVAFYVVVILITIVGNILIVVIIYKNKQMHTFTNILLCNCACADLMKILTAIFDVVDIAVFHGRWFLGLFLCIFWYICIITSLAVTNITLMVISIDRFLNVMFPYKKLLRLQMLKVIIPFIWMFAIAFASPGTFILKIVNMSEVGPVCREIWPHPFNAVQSRQHYTIIMFVFLYSLPLVTMTVAYSVIGKRLSSMKRPEVKDKIAKKHRSYIKSSIMEMSHGLVDPCTETTKNSDTSVLSKPDDVSSSLNPHDLLAKVKSTLGTDGNNRVSHKNERETNKTTKRGFQKRHIINMLIVVVIGCALSWLPVFLIQFLMYFDSYFIRCHGAMPSWVFVLVFFMQYLNSAINPIMYFAYCKSYRKGLKELRERYFSKMLP